MAHDDSLQPDPDRTDSNTPTGGALPSDTVRGDRVEGPDLVDRAARPTLPDGPGGQAGVLLGAAGIPDRESVQEQGISGASDLGAALERPTGLGGTRGSERGFEKTPGQITDVGGTRGTGEGTGQVEGAAGPP